MAKRLSSKEKGFAKDILKGETGTQSALNNYDIKGKNPENIASVIASENLAKPRIMEYLESKSEKAAENIYALANNAKNEAVKLSAKKDILDRAGFKAIEKTLNLNLNADITNPKAKKLADKYEEELKKNL